METSIENDKLHSNLKVSALSAFGPLHRSICTNLAKDYLRSTCAHLRSTPWISERFQL